MRNFLIILAAFVGLTAFGATNEPSIQMLATTNGVVKLPTNITSIRIGGTVFTNLLGFGLAVSNNQLSIDTTQLPAGGGGGGSGTVTSVGASTTVSGLGFSGPPVTSSGTLSLTGTVAVASGGTGATDASGARTALSLVPGVDVQAYDVDLAAIAALANSGIIARTGSGTVAARTITGDSEVVVSNGDGVSGNPTLSIGSAIARDSEVTAATAEATLESVIDLQDLQGEVTDAQVPNTITIDQATLALTGDSATSFFSSGEIEDARLPSGLARDSEVSATYAPLTSPAITGNPTINGGEYYNEENGDFWVDGFVASSGAAIFSYPFIGAALASGSVTQNSVGGSTNNQAISSINASASANSGYGWTTSESLDISGRGPQATGIVAFSSTNNVVGRCGYIDSVGAAESTDAAYIKWELGHLRGVVINNGSATYTSTSNLLATSSTTYYRLVTKCASDGTGATFWLLTATGPGTYTTNWTDSVTATLPSGASRATKCGIIVHNTAGSAGTELARVDAFGHRFTERLIR